MKLSHLSAKYNSISETNRLLGEYNGELLGLLKNMGENLGLARLFNAHVFQKVLGDCPVEPSFQGFVYFVFL